MCIGQKDAYSKKRMPKRGGCHIHKGPDWTENLPEESIFPDVARNQNAGIRTKPRKKSKKVLEF